MTTKSVSTIATYLALIVSTCTLLACSSSRKTQVPLPISSFMAPKGETRVTLYRLEPWGIEQEIQLTETDAVQVGNMLNSPATYSDVHLGCVTVGYGIRVERGGRHIGLLIDLPCYHVFDAETWREIGLLSEAGHDFFRTLLAKYTQRVQRPN